MQFEHAFPLAMYQLLLTHALAVGSFRGKIAAQLGDPLRRGVAVLASVGLALAFLLFAQAAPNWSFPAWSRLDLAVPERLRAIYEAWCIEQHPSLLQLLNAAAFFAALYVLLTYACVPVHRALGWLPRPAASARSPNGRRSVPGASGSTPPFAPNGARALAPAEGPRSLRPCAPLNPPGQQSSSLLET